MDLVHSSAGKEERGLGRNSVSVCLRRGVLDLLKTCPQTLWFPLGSTVGTVYVFGCPHHGHVRVDFGSVLHSLAKKRQCGFEDGFEKDNHFGLMFWTRADTDL